MTFSYLTENEYYLRIAPKHLKELPLEKLGDMPIIVLDEGLPEGTAYLVSVPQTRITVSTEDSPWMILNKKKQAVIEAIERNPNLVCKIIGLSTIDGVRGKETKP